MSVFEKNRETVRAAGEAVRKTQQEVATLQFDDESRRSRIVALLNNVSERLTEVSDSLVKDEDRANYEGEPAQEVREDNRAVAKEDAKASKDSRDVPRPGNRR